MARLTPQQYKDITRHRFGLLEPRPAGVPRLGPRTGPYAYVYARWANFVPWKAWRDRGGPRPAGVWRVVPKWDGWTPWDLLHEIRVRWPLHATLPPPPLPHPVPAHDLSWGQCWFVIAENWQYSDGGPGYFGRAFTADDGYSRPSAAYVAGLRTRGIRTAAWGDSRPPGMEGTSPAHIVAVAEQLGVDRPMFQAELVAECRAALEMVDQLGGKGYPLIMNRSSIATDAALYDKLCERLADGRVLGISECYKNCGWGDPDWGGLPMASTLGATYRDGQCSGATQGYYYDNKLMVPHRDSWYTAQWEPGQYAVAR